MNQSKPKLITIFFLMLIVQLVSPVFSQTSKRLDAEKWATELNKKSYTTDESYIRLRSFLIYTDSASALAFAGSYSLVADSAATFRFLNELAEKGRSKGDYFRARFNCLEAICIYFMNKKANLPLVKEKVKQLLATAMDIAYKTGDEYLVAFVSSKYAQIINEFGEVGLAIMYGTNSIELSEKLSYAIPPADYQFLAEMLYKVREYNDCIKYAKKAITAWKNSPKEFKPFTVSSINTVALGYHRQKIYDSAFIYYKQAFQLAQQINDTLWAGIVSGNMAQIYYALGQYDTAYTLLIKDYRKSKARGFYDNAGNSLQWAARANLARGNKATALHEVREAFQLLKLWPDPNYLKNTYYTTTQIFRKMGDYDSAFYYNNLWLAINDSIEKEVAIGSLAISRAKLNDERSRYAIQKLTREKKSQVLYRNFMIACILLLATIAFLYINKQRIKHLHKEQLAAQQKLAAELLAREQLQSLTQSLIQKTNLAEELQVQINQRSVSAERQGLTATLSSLTILTEADWEKFKSIFEQLYPGFFMNLRGKIPDISIAESRMAALARLQFPTSQVASILGISPNSVYKTRQRLRQRLRVDTDMEIDEFISSI